MTTLTLAEFRATGRAVADLHTEFPDEFPDGSPMEGGPTPGRVYLSRGHGGKVWIQYTGKDSEGLDVWACSWEKDEEVGSLDACEKFAYRESGHRPSVVELSAKFSEVLREWLTPEELEEVRRLNREWVGTDKAGCCASHNFCDANMAMEEACKAYGIDLCHAFCCDEEGNEDGPTVELINSAWDVSKANEFAPLLTLEEFRATGRDVHEGRAYAAVVADPTDGLLIESTATWSPEKRKAGRWYLWLDRSEYRTDDLERLEELLWEYAVKEGLAKR